jgi:hypothetical protein
MKSFKNVHVGKSSIVLTATPGQVKVGPKKIKINDTDIQAENNIIPWGSSNLYPQDFYNKKFLRNGTSVGGQNALKSAHYGTGIQLVKEEKNDTTGEVDFKKVLLSDFPEIRQFFRDNRINFFWYSKITDLSMWHISFTEHVLSINGNSIVKAKRHKAAHCRFSPQDENGNIPYVYINTDWANYNEKNTIRIDYIDYYSMTTEEIKEYCKEKGIENFITSSCYPLIDESYYPKTDWHAVDRAGWMDVANSVPELKQALFENQAHFKYIIYISDYYFESFYKEEWDEFDAEKRQKMREELSSIIDEYMSGNKAAGKSLVAPIFDESGQPVKGIIIEPIDNKLKDGSYLPDASAANTEILFSMGVDPVIIGVIATTGQSLGGSNKREAYTILAANLMPRKQISLDDFDLWRDFNGWDEDLIATFPSVNLTTLDKNPTGQEKVING